MGVNENDMRLNRSNMSCQIYHGINKVVCLVKIIKWWQLINGDGKLWCILWTIVCQYYITCQQSASSSSLKKFILLVKANELAIWISTGWSWPLHIFSLQSSILTISIFLSHPVNKKPFYLNQSNKFIYTHYAFRLSNATEVIQTVFYSVLKSSSKLHSDINKQIPTQSHTHLQPQISWINFSLNVQLFVCVSDHVAHAPFMTMHLKLLTC